MSVQIELLIPDDFEETLWESKGYFPEAKLVVDSTVYKINFYDPARLVQDITGDLVRRNIFFEENLVVVPKIDRKALQDAVHYLVISKQIARLRQSES
jgi:hypothetical protein